jgi:hypothetical protein
VAWGAPIPVVLLCATLIGLVLGSLGAVLRSIIKRPVHDQDRASIAEPLAPDVIGAPNVPGESGVKIDAMPTVPPIARHRRRRRLLGRSRTDQT